MLTDAACRKAKPCPDGKERKLPDALGLYLAVKPTGYEVWRFKYRYGPKEKKLVIGSYPDITLQEARAERDKARGLLRDGMDPSIAKKLRKVVAATEALDTLELIARTWHKERAKTLSTRYGNQLLSRLEENVFPVIGPLPIKKSPRPWCWLSCERSRHAARRRWRGECAATFRTCSAGLSAMRWPRTIRPWWCARRCSPWTAASGRR
ncbi:MAG TPA: Arm DNA-binding domain-containing protein [Novosphingobium sp.]|nr:Arm DNA-binding domain-containing protein [Novosphingobium sp.]